MLASKSELENVLTLLKTKYSKTGEHNDNQR